MSVLKKIASYFSEIPLKTYHSFYSGKITIALYYGIKILNTNSVNYSFNSLHRVFVEAFKKSNLQVDGVSNTLILGLGGGSIVSILRNKYFLTTIITAVEIDPIMIEIAYNEFELAQYNPLEIINLDALLFVKENTKNYDLICIDLFINEKVPDCFLSPAFIQPLLNCLNQGGILFFNIMVYNKQVKSQLQSLIYFLELRIGIDLKEENILEIEENNIVLVVKK